MKLFSQFIKDLTEKALSNDDLQDLIDRARSAAEKVEDDDEKTSAEKQRASEVLDWISDVEKTFNDENKLHPNSVNGLMRVIAGVGSGRYGRSKRPDGTVPKDYSR
jgi:molecular chaperone DnaK (HSP70)